MIVAIVPINVVVAGGLGVAAAIEEGVACVLSIGKYSGVYLWLILVCSDACV